MRTGFASIVGRPNVGKSTLLNTIIGEKVTITSPRANTTRHQIRGVLTREGLQAVFVDTPGLHRPKTRLGERLNHAAIDAFDDVDVLIALVEANHAVASIHSNNCSSNGKRWIIPTQLHKNMRMSTIMHLHLIMTSQ